MNQINVVIVDDEPLARENLRDLLSAYPEVDVVGEAGNVEEAARVIADSSAEVVFLDIHMPGESGFDLLPRLTKPMQVIFVTAYDTYAVRAFEVNAVDYLLKPIERQRLAEAIQRLGSGAGPERVQPLPARKTVNSRLAFTDDVLINAGSLCFFMPVADIAAIVSADPYVNLLLENGSNYVLQDTFEEWQRRLPKKHFSQLGESVIINLQLICRWQRYGEKIEVTFRKSGSTLVLG